MSSWARPKSTQQLHLCFSSSSSSSDSRGRQSRRVSMPRSAQTSSAGAISKKLKQRRRRMMMMMRGSVDHERIDGGDHHEVDHERGILMKSMAASQAKAAFAENRSLDRASHDKYSNYRHRIGQSEHNSRSVDEYVNNQEEEEEEEEEEMILSRMNRAMLRMQGNITLDHHNIIAGDDHVMDYDGTEYDDYDGTNSSSSYIMSISGGRLVGRGVFRQAFPIRWSDVHAFDSAASINTIAFLLQETSLNHMNILELTRNGTKRRQGSMRNDLIWVVTRLHIKMKEYPRWGNIIEIDSWFSSLGTNGIRRDFLVRDYHTKKFLGCATSNWVLMNGETHKLSKIPKPTRENISSYFLDRRVIQVDPFGRIPIIKDSTCFIKQNLMAKIYDFDSNQHVNPTKYVGWILESVPDSVIESSTLESITLEWRRECHPCDIMDSVTSFPPNFLGMLMQDTPLKFTHILRLQNVGLELVRAKTQWQTRR